MKDTPSANHADRLAPVQEQLDGAALNQRQLVPSEADFRALADNLPTLCWVADGDGWIFWYNRRWHDYCGTTAEAMEGWGWQAVHDPETLADVLPRWRACIETGEPFEMVFPIRGADGVLRPFLTRVEPMRDDSGRVVRWFGMNTNISALRAAEAELRTANERLELALNSGAIVGTWVWEIPSDRFTADERFARSFGLDPQQCREGLPLSAVAESIHPEDWPIVEKLVEAVLARGGAYKAAYRVRQDDGSFTWIEANGRCELDPEGRPLRFPGVLIDIAARKALEERQQLLIRELNHRVKNLFAIVSGMINMTARTASSTAEMAEALTGRLMGLARAHDLIRPAITSEAPSEVGATLEELLTVVISPHLSSGGGQLRMDGPALRIGPVSATSLSLVLHELATNAAKHGALSVPEGSVDLRWKHAEDTLLVTWTERDGPPIAQAPVRNGFGIQLSALSVEGQLGGVISYDWRARGVCVRLTIPLERLER